MVASTVRAALSEQRRLRARDRGRRWSVDEAVSFALALDPAGADPLGRQRPGMPAPAGEA